MAVYFKGLVFKTGRRIFSLIPNVSPDVEGSSRWATKREIRQGLMRINKKNVQSAQQAGVVLASDWRNYYVDTETVNSLFIGTTRSGKSQIEALMTIWLISQCLQKQSFIAFDMKAELLEYSYADLIQQRYEIMVLNFQDPAQSSRYSPLSIIISAFLREAQRGDGDFSETVEMTNELAQIITYNDKSDPVWPQSAKSLLVAIILFMLEEGYKRNCLDKVNMYSVYNFFIELGSYEINVGKQSINALDALMSSLPTSHPAKMAYATSKFAIGDMRSSIYGTLASNLYPFADSGIARMTSGNDIDFKKLTDPDKPCAVFLVVPDNKKSRYMLASLFVNQCYAQLLEYSHDYSRGMLPQRVRFILDELGNMPSIPDLSTKITTGLGHNILFDLYVQSMAQLEEKYGRLDAKTIQGNCGNWMYINSLDKDTNRYISDQLSNSTTEYKTYSGESGQILDRSQMSHYKSRPLMTHDELYRMKKGEVVTIRQRSYPIHTELPFFYKMQRPVTPIKDIKMQENKIPLRDILYPIDDIKKAVIAQVTKKGHSKTNSYLRRRQTANILIEFGYRVSKTI